jgi:ketosteroid isomerase-like protein
MIDVQRLADDIAVRDVVLGYARAVDHKDLDAVARCFTNDCGYEGSLATGTIADALATLRSAFDRYTRTMHFMGTQQVTLAGARADIVTYCIAFHVKHDGRHATVAVRYLDTLTRTAAGWRIARRTVRTDWTRDDAPALPA